MSDWLISVPNGPKGGAAVLAELTAAAQGLAQVHAFNLPPLKVGTLDSLIAISEETAKMDPFVGGVAKKIEKTYQELWKTEAAEVQAVKDKAAAAGNASSSAAAAPADAAKPATLMIENKTAAAYVNNWRWNEIRYPARSPLATLVGIVVKDATKSDEALKKQVAEYNEVRTSFQTIERKDLGTLLVRPLGQYVKKQPIETAHLTTLMIVVPRVRQAEFLDNYESFEPQAVAFAREEAARKELEAEQRSLKEAAANKEHEPLIATKDGVHKTAAQIAHDQQREKEKEIEAAQQAEAAKLEAELQDPKARARQEQEQKDREEEEKKKNKKLPEGCNSVVPRSVNILCDVAGEEFILVSVVVLKQGAESYKNLLREKRFTIRPFKYDPQEDQAERERKAELGKKKKALWSFLMRWCTTTYAEVFTGWVHLKAIRLYVESVLRYGLPFNSQAILLEPTRNKDRQLRDVLKTLYGNLAGNNANLTTALDPNETDLSGLGADFYSYVYLSLNFAD